MLKIQEILSDISENHALCELGVEDPITLYAKLKDLIAAAKDVIDSESFKELVIKELDKYQKDERIFFGYKFELRKDTEYEFQDDPEILQLAQKAAEAQEALSKINKEFKSAKDLRRILKQERICIDPDTGEAYSILPAIPKSSTTTIVTKKQKEK